MAYLESFRLVVEIHQGLFKEDPTDEEAEAVALKCEEFLENYPMWFPQMDITRKTYVLGMILPIWCCRLKSRV